VPRFGDAVARGCVASSIQDPGERPRVLVVGYDVVVTPEGRVLDVRRLQYSSVLVIAVALSAAITLGGCAPGTGLTADEQAIRATITRYDELLAVGYRSLNMNPIREVASQIQAETEYIHMSSLAEGGVRLDPVLKSLDFVRVSVESTSAQAETRETWDYRHYSRATGALVLEQKGLVYHLAWDLSRETSGTWLVTDVRAISTTTTVAPTAPGTITPVLPQP
jgi:hypothetical protein